MPRPRSTPVVERRVRATCGGPAERASYGTAPGRGAPGIAAICAGGPPASAARGANDNRACAPGGAGSARRYVSSGVRSGRRWIPRLPHGFRTPRWSWLSLQWLAMITRVLTVGMKAGCYTARNSGILARTGTDSARRMGARGRGRPNFSRVYGRQSFKHQIRR